MKYRPEIDGLRAVAVLLVLVFHADASWCPGGYIGVDVFFVISGYLITSIIRKEVAAGKFSLLGFYERRARRILPAFAVMLAIVLAVCLFVTLPSAFKGVGRSMMASALSVSNVLFWAEDGYFAVASEEKPLLHTWSLGVEEQFYFLLPLLIMWAGAGRKGVRVIAVCGMVSFVFSVWQIRSYPSAAFFLLPARAWELLLGSLLTTIPVDVFSARVRNTIALCGLSGVFYGAFFYSLGTAFPGENALLPCLGAAAIIVGTSEGLVSRVFSFAPFVFVGRISYSLYLWHWPVLVLVRQFNIVPLTDIQTVACLAGSFAMAVVSWKYVEQPFRSKQTISSRRKVFSLSLGTMAIYAIVGSLIHFSNGVADRFPEAVVRLDTGEHERRLIQINDDKCRWSGEDGEIFFGARVSPRIAVLGDSHATAFGRALGEVAQTHNESVQLFAQAGVAPLSGLKFKWSDQSHKKLNEMITQIIGQESIRDVVLVGRWAFVMHGFNTDFGTYERRGRNTPIVSGRINGGLASPGEVINLFAEGIDGTVARLTQAGKNVVLVYPVPEVGYHVPRTLARVMVRGSDLESFTRPAGYYFYRQRHVFRAFDSLADGRVSRVFPHAMLIDGDRAIVQENGIPFYHDDDHLSLAGAKKLVPLFMGSLWPSAQTGAVTSLADSDADETGASQSVQRH